MQSTQSNTSLALLGIFTDSPGFDINLDFGMDNNGSSLEQTAQATQISRFTLGRLTIIDCPGNVADVLMMQIATVF